MLSIRTSHKILWTVFGVLVAIMLFIDAFELFGFVLLATVSMHFFLNFLFAQKVRRMEDLKAQTAAFKNHQESAPDILEEVFRDEKDNGPLILPVWIEGKVHGTPSLSAPWAAGHKVLGWTLEAAIYRKTVLGGAADFSPLLVRNELQAFSLITNDQSVEVVPPGVLKGPAKKDELLSWDALGNLPHVKELIDNEMKVRGISRQGYTGVRLTQNVLEAGASVRVWAQASKTAGRAFLHGTDIEGAEDTLLIAPTASHRTQALRKSRWLDVLNAALAITSFSAALVYGWSTLWKLETTFPMINVERVGTLSWKTDGGNWHFEAQTLNLNNADGWDLTAKDESVNLVDSGTKAIVKADTRIAITRQTISPFKLYPATDGYPMFKASQYLLDLSASNFPKTELSLRDGPIYCMNKSDTNVEIRFYSPDPKASFRNSYWTLSAHQAENLKDGTEFVYNKKSMSLNETDGVLIRAAGGGKNDDVFLTFGKSPELVWQTEGRYWMMTLTSDTLKRRPTQLAVKNPNAFEIVLEVFDRTGKESVNKWKLAPGWGLPNGQVLKLDGKDFSFQPGMQFSVVPHAIETLYEGPISGYKGAVWKDGVWTVLP